MKTKALPAKADIRMLVVTSVTVSTGKAGLNGFDSAAAAILQEAGFIGLKGLQRKVAARVPGGETTFLVELARGQFRILRLRKRKEECDTTEEKGDPKIEGSVAVIDSGVTIYTASSGPTTFAFSGHGSEISDWDCVCEVAEAGTIQVIRELGRQQGAVPDIKFGRFEADLRDVEREQEEGCLDDDPVLDEPPEPSRMPPTPPMSEKAPPILPKPALAPPVPPKPPASVALAVMPSVRPQKIPMDGMGNSVMRVRVDEIAVFQPQNEHDPRFSGQPRKHFDEKKLRELAESMRQHGQAQRIVVRPLEGVPGKLFELVDGERRLRAAILAKLEYIDVVVEIVPMTKQQQHLKALVLNFNREGHTPLELSNALEEQRKAGMSINDLALIIGKTRVTVAKLLALQRIHPDLKPLLDPPTPKKERIPIQHGNMLAKIPLELQVGFWNQAKLQLSKPLALEKLNELGKPHFVYLRRRLNRHNQAYETVQRVKRRFDRLSLTLIEMAGFTTTDWDMYVSLRGAEAAAEDVRKLNGLKIQLDEFRDRLSRARVAFQKQQAK